MWCATTPVVAYTTGPLPHPTTQPAGGVGGKRRREASEFQYFSASHINTRAAKRSACKPETWGTD